MSFSYELTGNLKSVLEIIESSSGFKKQEFILTTDEQYPQHIKFELQNDKIDLLKPINIGDEIKITFNIRGKEWINPNGESVYFKNFVVWKLNKFKSGYVQPTYDDKKINSNVKSNQYGIDFDSLPKAEDIWDDLPF